MRPIVYHKNDFPVELSRTQSYTDFSVSWNDGLQKFCIRTGRCSGWRYDVTTSGAYDTFAQAYAAAKEMASALSAIHGEKRNVCLLHPEDNKQALRGSWGLSKSQAEELDHSEGARCGAPLDAQISDAKQRTTQQYIPASKNQTKER